MRLMQTHEEDLHVKYVLISRASSPSSPAASASLSLFPLSPSLARLFAAACLLRETSSSSSPVCLRPVDLSESV